MDITEEHVAAAQLRLVLDEKLGRATPEWVHRVAAAEVGPPAATPVPVVLPEGEFAVVRYLQTVRELGKEATPARLAERLGHSGPTTSAMLGRLLRDGLIGGPDERPPYLLTRAGALVLEVFESRDRDLVLTWPGSVDVEDAIHAVVNALEHHSADRPGWMVTRQGTGEIRISGLTEPEVEVVLTAVADWTSRNPGVDVDVRRGARVAEVRAEDVDNIAALVAALAG